MSFRVWQHLQFYYGLQETGNDSFGNLVYETQRLFYVYINKTNGIEYDTYLLIKITFIKLQ